MEVYDVKSYIFVVIPGKLGFLTLTLTLSRFGCCTEGGDWISGCGPGFSGCGSGFFLRTTGTR